MEKKEMTFSERFALIAMAGIRSERMTDALSAAVRAAGVAAAMEGGASPPDASALASRMFRKTVADTDRDLMKALSPKGLVREGEDIAALEVINVRARCRKADGEAFRCVMVPLTDDLRNDELTEEDMTMIWLLREAGALPFLLSPEDLMKVGESDALKGFPMWSLMFGKKLELGNVKRRTDLIPVAEGRTEGVFIEGIFLPEGERLGALLSLLQKREHETEVVAEGERPLLRIDGNMYTADMHARKTGRLTIEGIGLRPAWRGMGEGK